MRSFRAPRFLTGEVIVASAGTRGHRACRLRNCRARRRASGHSASAASAAGSDGAARERRQPAGRDRLPCRLRAPLPTVHSSLATLSSSRLSSKPCPRRPRSACPSCPTRTMSCACGPSMSRGWRVTMRSGSCELAVRPTPPTLIEPQDGAETSAAPLRFRWGSVNAGLTYRFQLARDATFSEPVEDLPALRDSGRHSRARSAVRRLLLASCCNTSRAGRRTVWRSSYVPAPAAVPVGRARPGSRPRRSSYAGSAIASTGVTASSLPATSSSPRSSSIRTSIGRAGASSPGAGRYFLRIRAVEPDGYEGPNDATYDHRRARPTRRAASGAARRRDPSERRAARVPLGAGGRELELPFPVRRQSRFRSALRRCIEPDAPRIHARASARAGVVLLARGGQHANRWRRRLQPDADVAPPATGSRPARADRGPVGAGAALAGGAGRSAVRCGAGPRRGFSGSA